MNSMHVTKFALLLAAIVSLSLARGACAAEGPADAKDKVAVDAKSADAQPAADADKPVNAEKQPTKATAKDTTSVDKSKSTQGKGPQKGQRSLIAPPGLMSQAPTVAPYTAPGLGKLNLNRATIEQIQRLPGVGVVWALRILAGRPYQSIGDLGRTGVPFTTVDALSREVELGP